MKHKYYACIDILTYKLADDFQIDILFVRYRNVKELEQSLSYKQSLTTSRYILAYLQGLCIVLCFMEKRATIQSLTYKKDLSVTCTRMDARIGQLYTKVTMFTLLNTCI